ncbi:uncharacterized protein LOC119308823 [Triticum dicoccoides]|uniref:uncharacterized protein LOC119308823 n=1 Tax=Triticum dicoccoides TaxID=85692 RepID=UPI001891E948|nr:uncharacterized protein LOC119308823 [Triticum dicoccoides]
MPTSKAPAPAPPRNGWPRPCPLRPSLIPRDPRHVEPPPSDPPTAPLLPHSGPSRGEDGLCRAVNEGTSRAGSASRGGAEDPAVAGLLPSDPIAVSQIRCSVLAGRLPQPHRILHRPEKPLRDPIFLPLHQRWCFGASPVQLRCCHNEVQLAHCCSTSPAVHTLHACCPLGDCAFWCLHAGHRFGAASSYSSGRHWPMERHHTCATPSTSSRAAVP